MDIRAVYRILDFGAIHFRRLIARRVFLVNMKISRDKLWGAAELADRWGYHRSAVIRVMRRFGFTGVKFGTARQAARRYADRDVMTVEKLAGLRSSASCNE